MNLRLIVLMGLGASLLSSQASFAAQAGNTQTAPTNNNTQVNNIMLKSDADKLGYTIGVDIGENLKSQTINANPDTVARGIQDAMKGTTLLMTKEEMQNTLTNLQKSMMAEQEGKAKEMKVTADQNAKAGQTFLDQNKKAQGIVALPSGLQYKVVEAGKGPTPSANDYVTVDYEGKLLNGNIFDSSYKRGKPVQFKVSQVITGWQEALQKMQPGSTWELYIPPQLAYGERGLGLGGPIGPNETLVFKVHHISIDKEPTKNN